MSKSVKKSIKYSKEAIKQDLLKDNKQATKAKQRSRISTSEFYRRGYRLPEGVMEIVPKVTLNSGYQMPLLGFGTAENCPFTKSEAAKRAILCAIKNGYRHFDTASMYQSEESLGEAIAEALHLGLIKSRNELFITSKLWCSDCHQDRVLPALKNTLQNLQLDYLDLYLIHFPLSSKRGKLEYPLQEDETYPMDFGSVWEEMEECQRVGLTKSIGVSNFSAKKIEHLLTTAKIIPAVDQVELNPLWQQRNLREYCKTKCIVVTAYSPLGAKGAIWGSNIVMENEVLAEIAKAKGKTHAQVCLRSVYEKGVALVTRSYNEERMKQNLNIFDWNLSKEETKRIDNLPQRRVFLGEGFLSPLGPFKSPEELWDGEM